MPELPEVETIRRQLEPLLTGARILDAWAFASAKFTDADAAVGSTVSGVRRRGKYLLIDLREPDVPDRELVVHLGMTGRLGVTGGGGSEGGRGQEGRGGRWSVQDTADARDDRHLRARWGLEDGRRLEFHDVRRFGRIAVVPRGEHSRMPTLDTLGPEPFDDGFHAEVLRRAVNESRRAVKTLLLSQRVVAGIGNIYADEALWRAGVHPRARRLTRERATALVDSVRHVLLLGLENGGTTLRDYRDATGGAGRNQHRLACYGRSGAPCRRCSKPLERCVVDARATTFCPTCQPRSGRPVRSVHPAGDGAAMDDGGPTC